MIQSQLLVAIHCPSSESATLLTMPRSVSNQDLRSFLDLIKNYDENDAIISVFLGFRRAYKAPNQRYECHLGIPRLPLCA